MSKLSLFFLFFPTLIESFLFFLHSSFYLPASTLFCLCACCLFSQSRIRAQATSPQDICPLNCVLSVGFFSLFVYCLLLLPLMCLERKLKSVFFFCEACVFYEHCSEDKKKKLHFFLRCLPLFSSIVVFFFSLPIVFLFCFVLFSPVSSCK